MRPKIYLGFLRQIPPQKSLTVAYREPMGEEAGKGNNTADPGIETNVNSLIISALSQRSTHRICPSLIPAIRKSTRYKIRF